MTGPDLLLINPNRIRPPVAPLAVDYLADALCAQTDRGFELGFLDLCNSADVECDLDAHFEKPPLLVAITVRNTDDCFFASQFSFLPELRDLVRDIRRRFTGPIVLGGSGFSVMPEAILAYCGLDYGIVGEGEWALADLMACVKAGVGVLERIKGLVIRHSAGEERRLHFMPPAWGNPDEFAAYRRPLVDNLWYYENGGQIGVETKRGCPKRCIYCADPLGKGPRCRTRSPEKVADEIESLRRRGIRVFHLCDSEFNLSPRHAHAVCRELTRRALNQEVRWYTYASPKPFDVKLAVAMREAGCAGIDFGADSGDAQMLKNLGRDFSPADLRRCARACREAGITFMFDLLLGGPGETRDSLRRTLDLMHQLEPDRVGISLGVRIYPGTRLAEHVRAQGPLWTNPHLRGAIGDNDSFLMPIYYVSADLGEDADRFVAGLVGGDRRFFFPEVGGQADYNYNENQVLVDAIRQGHRGAYWDILRRLQEGLPPLLSSDEAIDRSW